MEKELKNNEIFVKEYTTYLVTEKNESHAPSGWYFNGTLEECINYIKNECRNRNKKDGYDEYWHNVKLMIVKKTVKEEEFMMV